MLGIFKRNPSDRKKQTEAVVKQSRDSWFGKIFGLFRSEKFDDSVWEDLEEILVSADVGVQTSLEIIDALKLELKYQNTNDADVAMDTLKNLLLSKLDSAYYQEVWSETEQTTSPYVILMVGVNGVGKTTSIAKIANYFILNNKKVILGAADTFRAAAEEQLSILGQQLDVDVIKHNPGADPGAVAYDAYQAAKARSADVLIIDTAGRLHNKSNLMEELKKIRRVISGLDDKAPHQVILTIDATTGHNGLEQAKAFDKFVGCTGIFLSKLDGTARGGIVLAIHQTLGIPILFIGTGENIDDLAPFDSKDFVDALLKSD